MPATQRITVALPSDLLADTDEAIAKGAARSRSELIARALTHELEAFRCRRLDEAFAGMADDPIYREEVLQLAEEFAVADWEAFGGSEESR